MPSKKQRRRREKERRHEFEDAYYDADGNEITAADYQQLVGEDAVSTPDATGTARPIQRGGRTIHPPSWQKVVKRGLLFAPIMALTLYFLSPEGDRELVRVALSTAYLLALFIPFSYFMDRFMYRRFAARTGSGGGNRSAKRR